MQNAHANSGLPTFAHGVHPPERKEATEHLRIERMPFVDEYVLPLAQHIGAPSKPVVSVGQSVERGQLIAEAGGFVSTSLHAPVTGRVKAIELRPHPNGQMMEAIIIKADPYSDQSIAPGKEVDTARLSAEQMVKMVQSSGLVGLGGAAFPTHVKFSIPEEKRVQAVVINGCECEPYLTCDHRIMAEQPDRVLKGTLMIMHQVKAARGYIGIESNKPDAIEALRKLAPDNIEVIGLQVKYPQGAEKMLIQAVLRREVPSGKLPLDIEVLVNNVGTTAALADYFEFGMPLIERVVTVTGDGVVRPRNLLVPLGTPIGAVLDYCGGLRAETKQVVMGGPMMGNAQKDLNVPVMKGTSGLLGLTEASMMLDRQQHPCIKCGRCLEACPMFLNPTRLMQLARVDMAEELMQYNVMDCFECASCSFSCPSNIPLVQWIRMGKATVRQHQQKLKEQQA